MFQVNLHVRFTMVPLKPIYRMDNEDDIIVFLFEKVLNSYIFLIVSAT